MNPIRYNCLFLAFLSISFVLESREISNLTQDSTYLQYAEFFDTVGDLPLCLTTINELIARKEFNECYDDNYVKALYKAQNIYALIDINKAIEIYRKIQMHDKNLPSVKIENGVLTAEKFAMELDDEMLLLMKEIIIQSKMCEDLDDIKFSEGKMTIKLKPCCSCNRPGA
jgi:hypothetical protein